MVTEITSAEQLQFLDIEKGKDGFFYVALSIQEGKMIERETREKIKDAAEKYLRPLSERFNYEGSGAWTVGIRSFGKGSDLDPREYVWNLLEFWETIKDYGKFEDYSNNFATLPKKFFSWEKPIRIPD